VATYTTLDKAAVERICAHYPLTVRCSQQLAGGAANSSFLLDCAEGRFVLTVLDNHDARSARNLTCLLTFLAEQGVLTTTPMATTKGDPLLHWDGHTLLVKKYVPGRCDDRLPDELLAAAGAALAHINALTPAVGECGLRERGRRLPDDARRTTEMFADREFATWLLRTLDHAGHVTDLGTSTGLVHGDLFADNLVVTDSGNLVILDWETASIDLTVLDLAMAIVGLCRIEGRFSPERTALLLAGYTRERPLTCKEQDNLRDATIYASLIIAYHRYRRHHITHPNPAGQHLYREIPAFVDDLTTRWPEIDDDTFAVVAEANPEAQDNLSPSATSRT
jgi:homoserine kinase type II